MMHGQEKSDPAIVAMKPTNKAGATGEEPVERRAGTKGNADQHDTLRAQNRARVSQGLDRIREAAGQRKQERFTALLHHVRRRTARLAYCELKHDAAAGVDGMTWQDYEGDLERSLEDLHARVHRGAYRALPSRRGLHTQAGRPAASACGRRPGGQDRPRATAAVLNAIYEEDFLGFSYGFRPGRGSHDAMDALVVGIDTHKVNWILDADIRSSSTR